MKISIITICYNDKSGFEKTAKSIIAQTCKDFEWIIVDGGSSDGTVDSIKNAVKRLDPGADKIGNEAVKVMWKSEPDKGIYNAMNKGIKQASGDYLLFMNSGDCLYDEHVINSVLPLIQKNDIYIGGISSLKDGVEKIDAFFENFTAESFLRRAILSGIPHQASFINRRKLEEIGCYREELKVIADWYAFYKLVIIDSGTVGSLPIIISLYDTNGLSSDNPHVYLDRPLALDINPYQKILFEKYRENEEYLQPFRSCLIGRFLLRTYYSFYNRFLRK